MAAYGIYNFPDTIRGDTVRTRTFQTNLILTGFEINLFIRSCNCNTSAFVFKKVGQGIEIVTETVFVLQAFNITLPKGIHLYEIEFVAPSGFTRTYIRGSIKII